MAFSSKVDDGARAVLGQQSVDKYRVTDIASCEDMPRIALHTGKILQIARIGELVEIDDGFIVSRQPIENEVGADEPGSAGDQNTHLPLVSLMRCNRMMRKRC